MSKITSHEVITRWKTWVGESSKGKDVADRGENNKEGRRKTSFRDTLMGLVEDVEMTDGLIGMRGSIRR